MMFYFAFILAFAIDGFSAFSLIRDPCIVDTTTHDRFDERNLIFTIGEEYFEVHLPTGRLNKRGLIKDHWPEVLSVEGPINIATSLPGQIHFSKYVSNGTLLWAYVCNDTVYNCKLFRPVYSGHNIMRVVAGFMYQKHMPIRPQPAIELKGFPYVVLPASGREFLQCDNKGRKGKEKYQTGCTKYDYGKLNYTNFQVCRGDPDINKLTAISASYNKETKIVDFVMFFKGVMRYTVDGQFKQISIHQFVACPVSFKKASLFLAILTLLGILIGILVFSGVYYKKLRSLSSEDEGITLRDKFFRTAWI